ncbi:pimeloyl-ACP methyl ester carboxylesterase [Saccharothrix australiensis]|uniref:Pimeloyl-ACP methyl ester carboxylesterase n=1 Tax=Saccharothrix australiensis TaxID=2072 RepID=A0A495VY54_9PSEU|nr:pimeloyl-ACP methyl ester carboxylesterase [Saccharothrix australiensis]
MRTIEQRAAEFDRVHAARELGDWRYYTSGGGESGEAVLLLPGGAGIGISWVDLALALHPAYRTTTVDYPPSATTPGELVDGVLDVLDAEGIDRVHVVGQSAGGMVAEVLAQRAPDRVASLVFTGTGLYGPEDVDRLAGKVAAIRNTPWEHTLDTARAALRTAWRQSPEADFWIARVDTAYRRAGRDGLANSYAVLLDIARHSGELRPARHCPTLVLAADDDPLITPTQRQRLLDLHPDHELRVFPDGGHSLLLTRTADYVAEVTRHLREAAPPA